MRGAGASAREPERRAAAAWTVLEQGPAAPAMTRETREGDARSGAGGCYPGTGTRSSGRRRHEQEREGDGRQSGAPPQMEHAQRRPTDWKGGCELSLVRCTRGGESEEEVTSRRRRS
jgi:hypothetical protein